MDGRTRLENHTAIITGASSGIGEAIARRFAAEGLQVVLVARRLERLTQIADEINRHGNRAGVIEADLSLEGERQRLFDTVVERFSQPFILINNAGFSYYGYFSDILWETARALLEININAVVHLSQLFLPKMQAYGCGHIINIGSMVGQFPNQGTNIYAGTKAFLDAFTTALYRENQGTGVHVSVIRPGPVATELFDVSERLPGSRRLPAEKAAISAEVVAHKVWKMVKRPRRVAYVPAYTALSPWIELVFGGVIDRLGPLLLKKP